ncbi:MAG: DNRLRE domain-containing protein [Jatrophihabitantaceae bacterium]
MGLLEAAPTTPAVAAVLTLAPALVDAQSAPDEPSAKAIAARYGHEVVIDSLESETVEVAAEPDGTLKLTESSEPVRVQRNGGWVPVDESLMAAGGTLQPSAGSVPVRFSGGGAMTPLAQVQAPSGQWLTESWKLGALPAPIVSGDTATYPEVMPDVDLQLTATVSGLSEVLVIKSAEAAVNPNLAAVQFGIDDGALTTSAVAGGTVVSSDAAGTAQLAAPAPTWWDSSSPGASAAGPGGLGVPAPVPATSTATSLTIDASAVARSPEVAYPVYVDPDYKAGSTINWAFVDSAYPAQAYWKDAGASDGYQHVGFVNAANSDDGRDHTTQSFWQMDTSFLHGRLIQKAVLNTTEVYSFSCSPRSVELWTTSPISTSTSWQTRPSKSAKLDTESVAYGYSSACPGHVIGFTATDAVQRAADASSNVINLGLYASNETDIYGWKKFASNASLVVWFDTRPTVPSYRSVSGCSFVCGLGAYTKDNQPVLTGAAQDADGDNLTYNFEVYSGHSASPTAAQLVASGDSASVAQGYPASGQSTDANGRWTSLSLADGDYEYHVRADDGLLKSDWSGYLTFTVVHLARPSLPTITASGPLSTDPNVFAGTVGLSQESVTISPAASATDPVYAHAYGMFVGQPVFGSAVDCAVAHVSGITYSCAGLAAPVSVTVAAPDIASSFAVTVWDAAGNQATVLDGQGQPTAAFTEQDFWASPDTDTPARTGHQWSTTTSTPTTCAQPSSVTDLVATSAVTRADLSVPAGNPCWTTSFVRPGGTSVQVLSFTGGPSTAATGSTGLIDTKDSFTVGAWINAASGSPPVQTFLDQEGFNESVFFLQLVNQHLSFCMSGSDATSYAGDCITDPTIRQFDTWYYVAAVWDSVNQQIRLFTSSDGTTYTTSALGYHAKSWTAGQSVRLGADRIGTSRRYCRCMISDPYITSGILDGLQLNQLSKHSLHSLFGA